tara:strand:- start:4845 stop:5660 length:816 start_codon:yes stop_codon:yes gene_type:complete
MFKIEEYNFNYLKKYMLNNIDNIININNIYNIDNNNNINNEKNNKIKVSNNLIYIDYNKNKKKYNDNNNKYKEDTFFWCFYNLLYKENYIDEHILKVEKETKILLLEELRKNKLKLKKKYKLNILEDELLNAKKISFNTFCGLCCLKDISIFIVTPNNSYSYFLNNNELIENNMLNSYELFNFIELKYNNSLINVKNNNINKINLSENDYKNIINNYYYLENLEKPLKSITYYKLDDLISITHKLKINLYNDVNKKKTKKDLYFDILNKLK